MPEEKIKQQKKNQHKADKRDPLPGNIKIDQVAHNGKIGYGMEQNSCCPQKSAVHPGPVDGTQV